MSTLLHGGCGGVGGVHWAGLRSQRQRRVSLDPLGMSDLRTGDAPEEKYLVIFTAPLYVKRTHGPLVVARMVLQKSQCRG